MASKHAKKEKKTTPETTTETTEIETPKAKGIKNFVAEELRNLIVGHTNEQNIAVIPIDDFKEIYKGKSDQSNFKNFTSSVRNAVNNLVAIDNNRAVKEVKEMDVYSRNKMLAVVNMKNLK